MNESVLIHFSGSNLRGVVLQSDFEKFKEFIIHPFIVQNIKGQMIDRIILESGYIELWNIDGKTYLCIYFSFLRYSIIQCELNQESFNELIKKYYWGGK